MFLFTEKAIKSTPSAFHIDTIGFNETCIFKRSKLCISLFVFVLFCVPFLQSTSKKREKIIW